MLALHQLLSPGTIAIPLPARTRDSVISKMVALGVGTGQLWDAEKMAEAVRTREEMHPTALSCGVALLHPRRPMPGILSEPYLAMGRTVQGIPFGGSTGQLTDVFFLICSDSDQNHLKILARLSRLINDRDLLGALRTAESGEAVIRIVQDGEQQLSD